MKTAFMHSYPCIASSSQSRCLAYPRNTSSVSMRTNYHKLILHHYPFPLCHSSAGQKFRQAHLGPQKSKIKGSGRVSFSHKVLEKSTQPCSFRVLQSSIPMLGGLAPLFPCSHIFLAMWSSIFKSPSSH